MGSLKKVDRKLAGLKSEIQKLEKQRLEFLKRTLIYCQKCRKRSRLSLWEFIQTMYSRDDGVYNATEWYYSPPEDCIIVCPKCKEENRIYIHREKGKILKFKEYHYWEKEVFQSVSQKN